MAKESKMKKPVMPIAPLPKNYAIEARTTENNPFIIAYRKYQKDLEQYKKDLEQYEQMKLIRFIKNADERLIFRKYFIAKRK